MRTRYRYTSTRLLFLAVVLANVVSINIETNFSKTAVSGADGTYRILAFESGPLGTLADANRRFFSGRGMSIVFRGEFFNIFNHANFNNPVGNFSSSQFGEATSARDPRIGQVSFKFLW